MIAFAVLIGSGVGALARFEVGAAVRARQAGAFPWGTAVVNLLGAALLGILVGLADSGRLSGDVVTVLGAGFCGGFTTFSTWMVESLRLDELPGRPRVRAVVLNVGGMFVAGVLAAAATTNLV